MMHARTTDLDASKFFSSSVFSVVSETKVTTPLTGLTIAKRVLNEYTRNPMLSVFFPPLSYFTYIWFPEQIRVTITHIPGIYC
jgi:hypothetical protein